MSLKYEPSSEPLHNSAKLLFLHRELYLNRYVCERKGLFHYPARELKLAQSLASVVTG